MVEQENSKSSTVFPESLTSNSAQGHYSNPWVLNSAISVDKPEKLCSSDMLNIELLYGRVLPPNETFSSVCSDESIKEDEKDFLQVASPNDILSVNDSTHCDLFYNEKNIDCTDDYWSSMSEKFTSVSDSYFEANSPLSFWGTCPLDLETLKMDDVFQVDKDDLVQSPTLAELNANDESLFDSFDNFDIPLPSEHKSAKPLLTSEINLSPVCKISSLNGTSQVRSDSNTYAKTDLLLNTEISCRKKVTVSEKEVKSGFGLKGNESESLSTATPREKVELLSPIGAKITKKAVNEQTVEVVDEKKTSEASEIFGLSSNHETLDSDEDDSEMDCDYSSDIDDDSEEETRRHSSRHTSANSLLLQKKKSRYFWQYNIQSKGPKAPKMKLDGKTAVSDEISGISDPVFNSKNLIKGVKHAGKARRGDGNDLTPNPLKLYNIGLELEKLTSVIDGLVPANELPLNARSKSRKEKNKLASRACRLKKKAQHEANKLKLFGLQKEQKHLLNVINEVKKILRKSADNILVKQSKVQSNVHTKIENLCMKKCYSEVAGCSAEFVNNVLKIVDSGDKDGGLDIEFEDD